VLDDLGVPAPARTTVRASVEAVARWDEATQTQVVLGYRADAVTSVHFGDQAVAGRLMREATALSIGAQVQGPWWQIPPDDPARLQACRLAVDDARARAQAYAEAAGARLGTLVTIVDAGASAPGTPKSERMMAGMVLSGASEMDVSSGELQVSASVEVTFDLTAP